jgi:hypothetical protein
MNTWNTLPQLQWVYKNTLATVKRQIDKWENPTPAVVLSLHAAGVENTIFHEDLTSDVADEEHESAGSDTNIPIAINCTNDKLHFGCPGGSGD